MHDAYSKIISEASPQPLYSYAHCPFLGVRKWSDWQPSFKQIDANQSESKKKNNSTDLALLSGSFDDLLLWMKNEE